MEPFDVVALAVGLAVESMAPVAALVAAARHDCADVAAAQERAGGHARVSLVAGKRPGTQPRSSRPDKPAHRASFHEPFKLRSFPALAGGKHKDYRLALSFCPEMDL